VRKRIRRVLYGPPNWLVVKFNAEDRRMFGFWSIVFAIVGSVVLRVLGVGDLWWLLWLTVLSILALIPNYASETPVETEDQ